MKIAIVNDLLMAAEALRRAVTSSPQHTVAWIARDGEEAVSKCERDRPDIILMDLIMPVMNGVEATRRIMHSSPCAILIVTATVEGNVSLVFEAMGHGALDAVNTPVLGADGSLRGAGSGEEEEEADAGDQDERAPYVDPRAVGSPPARIRTSSSWK